MVTFASAKFIVSLFIISLLVACLALDDAAASQIPETPSATSSIQIITEPGDGTVNLILNQAANAQALVPFRAFFSSGAKLVYVLATTDPHFIVDQSTFVGRVYDVKSGNAIRDFTPAQDRFRHFPVYGFEPNTPNLLTNDGRQSGDYLQRLDVQSGKILPGFSLYDNRLRLSDYGNAPGIYVREYRALQFSPSGHRLLAYVDAAELKANYDYSAADIERHIYVSEVSSLHQRMVPAVTSPEPMFAKFLANDSLMTLVQQEESGLVSVRIENTEIGRFHPVSRNTRYAISDDGKFLAQAEAPGRQMSQVKNLHVYSLKSGERVQTIQLIDNKKLVEVLNGVSKSHQVEEGLKLDSLQFGLNGRTVIAELRPLSWWEEAFPDSTFRASFDVSSGKLVTVAQSARNRSLLIAKPSCADALFPLR